MSRLRRVHPYTAAIHEAGHAVAVWKIGRKIAPTSITMISIVRHEDRAGRVEWISGEGLHPDFRNVVALAGPYAQARHLKKSTLRTLLRSGDLNNFIPDGDDHAYFWKILNISRTVIRKHWHYVRALADHLYQHRTMEGGEAEDFLDDFASRPCVDMVSTS